MNKRLAVFESRNNKKKFRKLSRTKLGAKEGHSSIRNMENKLV